MSETASAPALEPSKSIILNPPIVVANVTYDRLELHEPTAKDMDEAIKEKSQIRLMIVLISRVGSWPLLAVERLPISKLLEAGQYCLGFSSGGLQTGEN